MLRSEDAQTSDAQTGDAGQRRRPRVVDLYSRGTGQDQPASTAAPMRLQMTTELAVQWAGMPATQHPVIWRKRLSTVRGFARYLATLDPLCEIPSTDLSRAHQARIAPYSYTAAEITELMAAAQSLSRPLNAATFETLIGLLACTGLRLREALGLERPDADLQDGVLDIRASKSHRQREVLLHPSATAALVKYTRVRDQRFPAPATPAFFVSSGGRPMLKEGFWHTFRALIKQAGLEGSGERVWPRPHDLRHNFAVRTLIRPGFPAGFLLAAVTGWWAVGAVPRVGQPGVLIGRGAGRR